MRLSGMLGHDLDGRISQWGNTIICDEDALAQVGKHSDMAIDVGRGKIPTNNVDGVLVE